MLVTVMTCNDASAIANCVRAGLLEAVSVPEPLGAVSACKRT